MEFEIGVTSDFAVLSMQKKKTYKMSSLECSQKTKIKTIVEITLPYFIFQYVLSFCLYLYPMVCC